MFEPKSGKELRAYSDLRDMLLDKSNGLIASKTAPEFISLVVVSVLAIIFGITVVGLVVYNPGNAALEKVTGIFVLLLGYFIGKAKSPA